MIASSEVAMSDRAKLNAEREQRFLKYLNDKWTNHDIAAVEGLEPYYAGKELARIARKHKLKIGKRVPQQWELPYGLDERTRRFRYNLGTELYNYRYDNKLHPNAVASQLGMTTAEQRSAIEKPWGHDWKLSQIQRLADAVGVPFEKFLARILKA
jgi:hypothetical protein